MGDLTSPSTYVLEVGYEKVYKRTYDEQMNILKKYQPPEKFHNSWKRSIFNLGRGALKTGAVLSGIASSYQILELWSNMEYILYRDFVDTFEGPKSLIIAYDIGKAMIQPLMAYGLISHVIPILPAYRYSEGLLFIPANEKRFIPKEKNSTQNKNERSDIIINIKPKEFDPIIHDIAKNYGGEKLTEQKLSDDIHSILYKFVDTKEKPIETQIKRFLYSLPVNVFLVSIYKIDGSQKNNETESGKALLFPRNKDLKKSVVDVSDLSRVDKKIIEYGETQVAIYNKVNKNIKYLVEYIRPPSFFKRLLPKKYRVPEFSPIV